MAAFFNKRGDKLKKTVMINGKFIPFKSSDKIPKLYKKHFGISYKRDFAKLSQIQHMGNPITMTTDELKKIDFDTLYQICWVFAKNANPFLPKSSKWLEKFDIFPMTYVLNELKFLLIDSAKY